MPKKKSEASIFENVEPRTTRRAASQAAIQNMQRLSATLNEDDDDDDNDNDNESDDPAVTYDVDSDDNYEEKVPPKRKKVQDDKRYNFDKKRIIVGDKKNSSNNTQNFDVTQKKLNNKQNSLNDNDDVIIVENYKEPVKNATTSLSGENGPVAHLVDPSLQLDVWVEELTPAQLERHNRINKEIDEINARIKRMTQEPGSELVQIAPNSNKKANTPAVLSCVKPISTLTTVNSNTSNNNVIPTNSNVQLLVDPVTGILVGTLSALGTTSPLSPSTNNVPKETVTRKRAVSSEPNVSPPPAKVVKRNEISKQIPKQQSSVVDLTSDDTKQTPDTKEVSFSNILAGKTFPSLVIVAKPHLTNVTNYDRSKLDAKVKRLLMNGPTAFAEWLMQKGLILSHQLCTKHPHNKLKLGMYNDESKFPNSGGYVWLSECCPQKFVSVFSGSIFEGSPHPPTVILKLIYHWACQTNIQNIIQWVKVDKIYVKGINTWMRAACTLALHKHIILLGGPNVKVEIGVISLGTTSQDGQQKQVKVEVLGVLECATKKIRLHAVEPLPESERSYKRRFTKILEPLCKLVHPQSIIITDLTVDKSTLIAMGFKNVIQSINIQQSINNRMIMDYLRRIVPRMFQNTLSLLSRQIIQQFLDELVWREWFGTTAAKAFDNILAHISLETGHGITSLLNRVAADPFYDWSLKSSAIHGGQERLKYVITKVKKTEIVIPEGQSPSKKVVQSENTSNSSKVPLEHYYYGTIKSCLPYDKNISFSVNCTFCQAKFSNNIKLMNHLFTHIIKHKPGNSQCKYCLMSFTNVDALNDHIENNHHSDSRTKNGFVCLICETKFESLLALGTHLSRKHYPSEIPYLCGTCGYRCSYHKQAIDHFYMEHNGGATIQCPLCLKVTTIVSNDRFIVQNMHFFLQHLNKHLKKVVSRKCDNCTLWFAFKEVPKDHVRIHESACSFPGLQKWPLNNCTLTAPKSVHEAKTTGKEVDLNNLVVSIPKHLKCLECSKSLNSNLSFKNCPNTNCRYSTCCTTAMQKHVSQQCQKQVIPKNKLSLPLHCICGYSDDDGYGMADHLVVCERKSAYPSAEAAKAASVTHSMLDVLGLVRKPEEPAKPVLQLMEIASDNDEEDDKKDLENSHNEGKKGIEDSDNDEKNDEKDPKVSHNNENKLTEEKTVENEIEDESKEEKTEENESENIKEKEVEDKKNNINEVEDKKDENNSKNNGNIENIIDDTTFESMEVDAEEKLPVVQVDMNKETSFIKDFEEDANSVNDPLTNSGC